MSIMRDTATNLPKTVLPSLICDQARGLDGRRGECEMLDRVVTDVRTGQSRVLVLRGEPGTGKTALLDYLAQRAVGCRVARMIGVEPEMEMAFAGLHQLCAPFVGRFGHLPDPQRDALRTAFNMQDGNVPDRFAVGMATLSLLSDLATERPLVCVVDDAQLLDQASAQALASAGRRTAWVGCRSFSSADWPTSTRGRCLTRSLSARWTNGCATGSLPRRAASPRRCSK
jgi:AAA ATPase domain